MPLNSRAVHVCCFYPSWKQTIPVVFIMCKSVLLFNPERKVLLKNSYCIFSPDSCAQGKRIHRKGILLCNGGTLAHGLFATILWGTESSLALPLVNKLLLLTKALKDIFQQLLHQVLTQLKVKIFTAKKEGLANASKVWMILSPSRSEPAFGTESTSFVSDCPPAAGKMGLISVINQPTHHNSWFQHTQWHNLTRKVRKEVSHYREMRLTQALMQQQGGGSF